MKFSFLFPLIVILFVSCGDTGFFSEAYWSDPSSVKDEEEAIDIGNYSVVLEPISSELVNVSGSVNITVNETDAITHTLVDEFPQSMTIGQGSITNKSCSEVIATNPSPVIVNNTGEFKKLDLTDSGSREALIAQLNQDNSQNGESVSLRGKSYVLRAYVSNLNLSGMETVVLVPVACGVITFED